MPSVFKPWDAALVAYFLDRIRVAGITPGLRDAAVERGKTPSAVGAYLRLHHRAEYDQAKSDYLSGHSAPISGPIPQPASTFPLEVRPFAVEVPKVAVPVKGRGKRAFIIPDVHVPFQDDKAVAVMESILAEFKPDILVQIGDMLDAGRLSQKFPTDPARIDTLQGDIDHARTLLHRWAQIAPQSRRYLLEGNHEQRLTRLIWGLEGAQRELAKLRIFQEKMTWPEMLELAPIGWEWVPYGEQPRADILPYLLVKHGTFVSSEAGMTAKREWQKAGRSGISGHTHRANVWHHRDWNGQATWVEAGCLCDLTNTPPGGHPNWQQAVTLLEWSADGALMDVEQVILRNGRAVWRGKELAA